MNTIYTRDFVLRIGKTINYKDLKKSGFYLILTSNSTVIKFIYEKCDNEMIYGIGFVSPSYLESKSDAKIYPIKMYKSDLVMIKKLLVKL